MARQGRNADELGELVVAMLASAKAHSAEQGENLTAENFYFDAGLEAKGWGRARKSGYLSKNRFGQLNGLCKVEDQERFEQRYEAWREGKWIISTPSNSHKRLQWRYSNFDSIFWERDCARLLASKGCSLSDIGASAPEVIDLAVHKVRNLEGEDAAAENAFLLMQAAYARFSSNVLRDRRALLIFIAATIDLSALTSNRSFLKRSIMLLDKLRAKDPFAACLYVDCYANLAEADSLRNKHHLPRAAELFGEHVQLAQRMIATHEAAPEFPSLHRARLGAFLNYGMILADQGKTFAEAWDHIREYQDAIESINMTNGIPGMDGQIFEGNGDMWHAVLLAQLKLNGPRGKRSRTGGDPEGALAEIYAAVARVGGIEKLPRHNALKLLRLENRALKRLGRVEDAEAVSHRLVEIGG